MAQEVTEVVVVADLTLGPKPVVQEIRGEIIMVCRKVIMARPEEVTGQSVPEAVVGLGTVLTREDLMLVRTLDLAFAFSPGATPELLDAAREMGVPFVPGIADCTRGASGSFIGKAWVYIRVAIATRWPFTNDFKGTRLPKGLKLSSKFGST